MTRAQPSWAESHPGTLGIMVLAGVVVVGVGIKLAAPILVPFVLAAFVTTVSAPLADWLRRRRVPRSLAIISAVFAAAAVLIGLGAFIVLSASQLAVNLPKYARLARAASDGATVWLQKLSPALTLPDLLAPGAVSAFVASVVGYAVGFVMDAVLALIISAFMLFQVVRDDHTRSSPSPLRRAMREVNKYMAVKSAVSAATGVAVGLWLGLLGSDMAVFFGLLAFLLNYIPNVGSILAALPAILLALLHRGVEHALLVTAGYVAINIVIGNVLEPRVMGRALGLSPIAVLLSVIVWALLLGPVGALLSALLTVAVKLALSSTDDLRHLAAYLGPVPPKQPGKEEREDLVEVVVPQTDAHRAD